MYQGDRRGFPILDVRVDYSASIKETAEGFAHSTLVVLLDRYQLDTCHIACETLGTPFKKRSKHCIPLSLFLSLSLSHTHKTHLATLDRDEGIEKPWQSLRKEIGALSLSLTHTQTHTHTHTHT